MGFTDRASVITSRSNARVKQLRAAFAEQARLSGGLIAIEGDNLLGEALHSNMGIKTIFVSEHRGGGRQELPWFIPRGAEVLWIADEVFASVVETQSPQGTAALLVPPVHRLETVLTGTPLILIAAGIQDPGNLGTLIRSAEAFGASGVLTTVGTVDPWNQKAVRASAGSVFRVPVVPIGVEHLHELKRAGVTLLAAVLEGSPNTLLSYRADFTCPCAILIGNEGSGLSHLHLSLASLFVTIPSPGRVESLNAGVAGSLLLYEASRQRAARPTKVAK